MASLSRSYHATILGEWKQAQQLITNEKEAAVLDGTNLGLCTLIAVARHGTRVDLDFELLTSLNVSHNALQQSLAKGEVIYGINTGFGGSANTRTNHVEALQEGLLREFNSGILMTNSKGSASAKGTKTDVSSQTEKQSLHQAFSGALPIQDLQGINLMPPAWVRAMLAIRINSLLRGYSGVRRDLVELIYDLLLHDVIPQIPVFGSISASGDLSPLSYIGSVVQGKANVNCIVGSLEGIPRVVDARTALNQVHLEPQKIHVKEALAIMNGTAPSAAVGALAIHDCHGLAVFVELLTAMSVESLRGSRESFDEFLGRVRPHVGQIESSRNIHAFLEGSKLVKGKRKSGMEDDHDAKGLKQDRYSIRTAAQWMSPIIDDLHLAHEEVVTEMNSVTDNPLIDLDANDDNTSRFLHGGNFQARSITSAMDKARQALYSMARMMFTQSTEIINPATNFGLPPNLVADEPNESFMFKSIDIMIAALVSELGFLANPVGTHVQTAEMGNQALNSLALISARYTLTSVDLVSKLAAAHLLVTCQALDLRVMDELFFETLKPKVVKLAIGWCEHIGCHIVSHDKPNQALPQHIPTETLFSHIRFEYEKTTSIPSHERFNAIAKSLQPLLLDHLRTHPDKCDHTMPVKLEEWTTKASTDLYNSFHEVRKGYLRCPSPQSYLGDASKAMYKFVRETLAIPILTTAVLTGELSNADGIASEGEFATVQGIARANGRGEGNVDTTQMEKQKNEKAKNLPTIGDYVTKIYSAIRSGAAYVPAYGCLEVAQKEWEAEQARRKEESIRRKDEQVEKEKFGKRKREIELESIEEGRRSHPNETRDERPGWNGLRRESARPHVNGQGV